MGDSSDSESEKDTVQNKEIVSEKKETEAVPEKSPSPPEITPPSNYPAKGTTSPVASPPVQEQNNPKISEPPAVPEKKEESSESESESEKDDAKKEDKSSSSSSKGSDSENEGEAVSQKIK